jgi:hypothetical protein
MYDIGIEIKDAFYVRSLNTTTPLNTKQAHDYITDHWRSSRIMLYACRFNGIPIQKVYTERLAAKTESLVIQNCLSYAILDLYLNSSLTCQDHIISHKYY